MVLVLDLIMSQWNKTEALDLTLTVLCTEGSVVLEACVRFLDTVKTSFKSEIRP